jgi:U3 small nucleolar RNA-associated protein 14
MSRRNNNKNNGNGNGKKKSTATMKEPRIIDGNMNDSDDDEEIDEDMAFNSEDELMYGSAFQSSSKKTRTKTSKESKESPEGGGDASDDDDDDGSDDDESDDSDESDEGDWAGSSDDSDGDGGDDDGGQYMLDLLSNLDSGKGGIDGGGKKTRGEEGGGRISLTGKSASAAMRMPESEFRSGSLSAMTTDVNGGDNDGRNGNLLTLDSLMGTIADTANFAHVQRSMRALSSGIDQEDNGGGIKNRARTTSVPVSRVVSDRASRRVHYASTTQDVSLWTDAIHEKRDAETLDFRTNAGGANANRVTRDTLVEKFVPTNDFEREIQDALEKAGMDDEESMARREKMRLTGEGGGPGDEGAAGWGGYDDEYGDDLGSNAITAEEYKKRHGELAKLRALMFYEEQKRHRINKIKSKKYRKIRKRQRDKLKDGEIEAGRLGDHGGEDDRERIEREEMDRMRERMTLAHKNTSKWARHMLRRGSKMDVEERRALSLQIARGEELRRKANGEGMGDDNDGTDDETEEDLLRRARDILMETRDDDDDDGKDGTSKKGKGLFQLEFMKRGMEAQRTRAREEARKLLEELEANDTVLMSTDDEDDGVVCDYDVEERRSSMGGEVKKRTRVATEAETNEILPGGKLVASSLMFGRGDGFAIKVGGEVELGAAVYHDAKEVQGGVAGEDKKSNRKKRQKGSDTGDTGAADTTTSNMAPPVPEEEENPWIVTPRTKRPNKPPSRTVNINEAASMLVDGVGVVRGGKPKRNSDKVPSHGEGTEALNEGLVPLVSDKEEVRIADLSQAELVRRAFSAPVDLEAEADFEREKVRVFILCVIFLWST